MKTNENELIATFMGGKFEQREYQAYALWNFDAWTGNKNWSSGYSFESKNLMYNKSWDWLMPVLEKIESMGYDTVIRWQECVNTVYIHDTEADSVGYEKIESVFNAVVSFIKWYNTKNNQ